MGVMRRSGSSVGVLEVMRRYANRVNALGLLWELIK